MRSYEDMVVRRNEVPRRVLERFMLQNSHGKIRVEGVPSTRPSIITAYATCSKITTRFVCILVSIEPSVLTSQSNSGHGIPKSLPSTEAGNA